MQLKNEESKISNLVFQFLKLKIHPCIQLFDMHANYNSSALATT